MEIKTYYTPDGKYSFTDKNEYIEFMNKNYGWTVKEKPNYEEKYPQGVFIDEIPSEYNKISDKGKMIRISIQKEIFNSNNTDKSNYVSFIIKRSKAGKLYAEKWK